MNLIWIFGGKYETYVFLFICSLVKCSRRQGLYLPSNSTNPFSFPGWKRLLSFYRSAELPPYPCHGTPPLSPYNASVTFFLFFPLHPIRL